MTPTYGKTPPVALEAPDFAKIEERLLAALSQVMKEETTKLVEALFDDDSMYDAIYEYVQRNVSTKLDQLIMFKAQDILLNKQGVKPDYPALARKYANTMTVQRKPELLDSIEDNTN